MKGLQFPHLAKVTGARSDQQHARTPCGELAGEYAKTRMPTHRQHLILGFPKATGESLATSYTRSSTMESRHLDNGQYFPPIAPNGRVYAVPVGHETRIEIFCLPPIGIVGASIQSHRSEIIGCYYDESWKIIPRNYSGRGMRFRRDLHNIIVITGNEALPPTSRATPLPYA